MLSFAYMYWLVIYLGFFPSYNHMICYTARSLLSDTLHLIHMFLENWKGAGFITKSDRSGKWEGLEKRISFPGVYIILKILKILTYAKILDIWMHHHRNWKLSSVEKMMAFLWKKCEIYITKHKVFCTISTFSIIGLIILAVHLRMNGG